MKPIDQNSLKSERPFGKSSAFKGFLIGLILSLGVLLSPKEIAADPMIDSIEVLIKANREVKCVASVIYDEARGEPLKGKIAVAAVVKNRVESKTFPNTACGVVYHQMKKGICQFTGMCKSKSKKFDQESLEVAYKFWIKGTYKDPTQGATHFYNPSKVSYQPKWSTVYARTARIGKHVFFKQPTR